MHFFILGTTVYVYVKKSVKKYFRLPFIPKNTVRGYTYDAGYTYGIHCKYNSAAILNEHIGRYSCIWQSCECVQQLFLLTADM